MEIKQFDAIYQKAEGVEAGYIEIPFDVEKEFGAKRVKVVALLDGVEYRGSLVRMQTACHILGIPKEIRIKMGKTFGDTISVALREDKDVRTVALPEDLKNALAANQAALDFYRTLSFTNQKKMVLWIESAKKEETRSARVREAIGLLENKQIKK